MAQPAKILVTGGAGYIGSHTVVELQNEGFDALIIDDYRNSEKDVPERIAQITNKPVKVYEGDCASPELLKKVFKEEGQIDGVIHFAADKAVGESMQQPLKYYHNNIGSLVALLQACVDNKTQNFVFSSSCTVYGEPDSLPVTEANPVKQAESPYGNTKQISEEILNDSIKAGFDLKTIALRYFNPIGAHPSALIGELPIGIPNNLVPFITQTAAGIREQLTVFGDDYDTPDGTNIRDYIHVVDLARAHVAALRYLKNSEKGYSVFNVGTGKGNSVLEVIKTFEKVTGQKLNYKIGKRRAGDVVAVYAATGYANKELGWQAQLSLSDALADAWRWQQKLSAKNK